METIKLKTAYIKLHALLKFAALVASGGEAKEVVGAGLVSVNGEVCTMRGRKLRAGDTVGFEGETVEICRVDIDEN